MKHDTLKVTSHQTGPALFVGVTDESGKEVANFEVYVGKGGRHSVFASTARHDRVLVRPETKAAVEAQARRDQEDSREWRPGFPALEKAS